ncbi:MAG: glycosyl transferase family 2 [Candidatus Edwardsbacteria bacterium RIFOXYD12_FULL_50_11]|uniref:Glycosyl transferase family 2 n=1 Tax=Candidatus Edwardsbacteria bacterium GWF2_54_11 TaxID=1817851 RepID=A0A1F5R9S3_9BACT|nr:MAG: glycosyl transferase family 2 [Candidatus Edwardsbacteria bacterium RifOxyC12_full_54_24]OGF08367.1 MAG: glycosyl transferase family 2 [Candidatus Edwardsbacteria bacterium RifOxyA12_full_54_48]OGF11182.1 MAG: glycosyl transferase family 2 [Candidatus Edwardsbacteria bacterium GWF2_54_11]OGF11760.1 MAG: glycosyl transferase family 2 [Candidatus Edwardsbacteria bacterium GWE2_54_12]OGF14767.1 MAG: glycosyl transferase family 2 [Candidatus Edwardsbacteria bacterium RIFOXYD12_FULL_50_11]O
MPKKHDILTIIPAFNEAGNIARVLEDLGSSGLEADILVVNDASSDETSAVARAHNVRVIDLPVNLGIGGAVQTGFIYAQRNGYHIAVQFDGDGQHLAGEIPALIAPLLAGRAEVVIGSRFLTRPYQYKTAFFRRLGMRMIQFVNSLLIGQRITDNTSGFRAYNRRALKFLAQTYPDDFPEPEAVVLLGRNGFVMTEVPVKMEQRKEGASSLSGIIGPYYMIKVLLTLAMNAIRPKIRRE